METYCLKSNVVIEPLVARYRSSAYLISPCTAPRFLRHLIKRLLSSFVKSPKAHELALKNKLLQGGLFVGLSIEQKEQAEQLLAYQNENLMILLQVAEEQDQLCQHLKLAKGEPLDDFMLNKTCLLDGLLEFYYTRTGQASYRMIEGLLYKSEVYQESIQEIALYPISSDTRSFALTTPKLANESTCFLQIPHNCPSIDVLSQSRTKPVSDLRELANALYVKSEDYSLFCSLFEKVNSNQICNMVDNKPTSINRELRTRYFGHACIEISYDKTTILVDPLISYSIPGIVDQRLTFNDLPPYIDAVVITHIHLDHFCIETLLQLRHKVSTIIIPKTNGGTTLDPSGKWILRAIGFKNIIELDATEQYQCNNFTITAIPFPGEHGCLDITSKSIFSIQTPDTSLVFAADIRTPDKRLLQRITNTIGPIDTLFLGMEAEGAPASWLYGPLLDEPIERQWDQKRRLNGSDSELGLRMIEILKPEHVRIYALGREPWLSHLMRVDSSPKSIGQQEIDVLTQKCKNIGVDISTLYMNSIEFYENCNIEKVSNY